VSIDVNRSQGASHRAEPTSLDLQLLTTTMNGAQTVLGAEQFDAQDDTYLDGVIDKPWGLEYRVYADMFYDAWALRLLPGHSTSMHCHPRKDTALLCLARTGTTHFLDEPNALRALDVMHIRRGVFHRTENTSDGFLDLVEIELPRNKLDLVRSGDRYGRTGRRYETQTTGDCAAAMSSAELVPHARLRRASLTGEYRFDIERGDAIARRADPWMLFAVSLALHHAISNEIDVVALSRPEAAVPDPDVTYFTISRQPGL
jgi:mannose-6-phosphate isomerase-like protein (cupin superfamily)